MKYVGRYLLSKVKVVKYMRMELREEREEKVWSREGTALGSGGRGGEGRGVDRSNLGEKKVEAMWIY